MDGASAVGSRAELPARWSLRLLGGFELRQLPGGERVAALGKRERVALAYLALSPNFRRPRRKLATLLWGDATDATLLDNLRTCLWSLRKALGDTEHRIITSDGDDIVLKATAFDIDAVSFRRLAAQSGLSELEAVAKLSNGLLLEGLDIDSEDYESWRREESTRFRDQTIDVLNRLMTQLADSGETERAIAAGTRLLRLEPLHEGAVRRLMRLYAGSDRRGAAIEVYRALAETLRSELSAQPKAETRAVYAEITQGGDEHAKGLVISDIPSPSPAVSAALPSAVTSEPQRQEAGFRAVTGDLAGLPGAQAWGMAEFFAELKRRNIYRVGAAYLVVAWTLAQFIEMLWQIFALPPWIARPAVILLAIGFPIALVAAWTIEAKPQQAIASAVRTQNATVDWALFSALAVVTILIGYQQLARPTAPTGVVLPTPAATVVSIAVLPLANLSGDASQEFFSDGLTEEITATLAKLPDLRVVGRTSAFQFKGQNQDLRAIGQALAATHLLEGSVRKDGDRLRVTTQLIKADDGTHVWAENYDRQLTDIFAIQEEIARAIAAALRMPLGLAAGQTLVALRPKDEETYELFLRGRAAFRARRGEEAVGFLDQAVARDPNFAPAWRYLMQARNTENIGRRVRGLEAKTFPESDETLARRVIALAPDSSDGYAMLANLAGEEGQMLEAMQLREQALQRDPNDVEVMNGYANSLWELGYLKQALEVRDRQHVLEPLIPIYNFLRAETLAANGMLEQAVRDWEAARPFPTAGGIRLIAPVYARQGRFDDAIEVLLAGTQASVAGTAAANPRPQDQIDAAVRVLRAAKNKTAPPTQLPDFPCPVDPFRALDWAPYRAPCPR